MNTHERTVSLQDERTAGGLPAQGFLSYPEPIPTLSLRFWQQR